MSDDLPDLRLLTPDEMQLADRLTIASGISGPALMRAAGRAVAEAARRRFPAARRFACLAGPGNNGGDAFEAARHLIAAGCEATVFLLGDPAHLSGDAAGAAAAFGQLPQPLASFDPTAADVVIDGLFGAGLARPVEGGAAHALRKAAASGRPAVAIDLPSGVSGLTGAVLGLALPAALTVTFFRRKPGHLLEPGRSLCGDVAVADIGIEAAVLERIDGRLFANEPKLWPQAVAAPGSAGHKYDRGHAVVFSGGAAQTGAARMTALAALRTGAGLVTVFSPPAAVLVNAAHLTTVMIQSCADAAALREQLKDTRLNAFAIGPGFGIGTRAREFVQAILDARRAMVIDADAITSFREEPAALFAAIQASDAPVVLTPHAGEFARLFPDLGGSDLSKVERAREAARRAGAVVLFKGADTVIASPDGRAAINATGSAYLATAGTGDVLAGVILGFLAQGVPAFEAAAAAAFVHGRAGQRLGPGLIAEELPHALPAVFRDLLGVSGLAGHLGPSS